MPNPLVYVAADFTTSSGAVDPAQLQEEFMAADFNSTPLTFNGIDILDLTGTFTVNVNFNIVPDVTDEAEADAIVAAHTATGPTTGITEGATEPFGAFGKLQNYLRDSENLDDATSAWQDVSGNTTVTANNAFAPNGEQTADTVQWDTVGIGLRQFNLATVDNGEYSVLFWGRHVSGNTDIRFDLHDGQSPIVTLDKTMRRYCVHMRAGTGSNFLDISVLSTVGTFELWGLQIVDGFCADEHPYLKTTDTAQDVATNGAVTNNITHLEETRFRPVASIPNVEGTVGYLEGDHALSLKTDIAGSTQSLGQEFWIRVINNTGVTIADGTPVFLSGHDATAGRPEIDLARGDDLAKSDSIGFTTNTTASIASSVCKKSLVELESSIVY